MQPQTTLAQFQAAEAAYQSAKDAANQIRIPCYSMYMILTDEDYITSLHYYKRFITDTDNIEELFNEVYEGRLTHHNPFIAIKEMLSVDCQRYAYNNSKELHGDEILEYEGDCKVYLNKKWYSARKITSKVRSNKKMDIYMNIACPEDYVPYGSYKESEINIIWEEDDDEEEDEDEEEEDEKEEDEE